MFQTTTTSIKDPVGNLDIGPKNLKYRYSKSVHSSFENLKEKGENSLMENNNEIKIKKKIKNTDCRARDVKLHNIVPYHIRLQKYIEKRKEIFGDGIENKKIMNARFRYSERKSERRDIASSVIPIDKDVRPYLKVVLNGVEFSGLMDSGASVSCLGKNCLENIAKLKVKVLNFRSVIRTADGVAKPIIGKALIDVKCREKTVKMIFYLVPSLSQELILGWTFWQNFGITPCFMHSIDELDANNDFEDNKLHRLSRSQQIELDHVKEYFRCYTRYGLGKTHLESHSIDTGDAPAKKMRFYPVSPAVQKLTYAELDRMLELDVIEPAQEASWNNRMTLVIKPNKNRRIPFTQHRWTPQ